MIPDAAVVLGATRHRAPLSIEPLIGRLAAKAAIWG
jgi:hypothetical protein